MVARGFTPTRECLLRVLKAGHRLGTDAPDPMLAQLFRLARIRAAATPPSNPNRWPSQEMAG
jgi:hypothetical protein